MGKKFNKRDLIESKYPAFTKMLFLSECLWGDVNQNRMKTTPNCGPVKRE